MAPSKLYSESLFLALVRFASVSASLATVALAAHALDGPDFVLTAVMSSFYATVGMFDFGMGSAAQEAAAALPEQERRHVWVRAGRKILKAEALLLIPLAAFAFSTDRPELVLIGVLAGLGCVPLALIERYRAVRRQSRYTALASLLTNTCVVVSAAAIAQSSHPEFLAVVAITVQFGSYLVQVVLALRNEKVSHEDRDVPAVVLSRSRASRFFMLQLANACIFNVDVLILALLLPADEVAAIAVALRLAVAGGALVGSLLQAIWPHVAATPQEHRAVEMRRVLRLLALLSGGCLAGASLCATGVFTPIFRALFADEAPTSSQATVVCIFLAAFAWADGFLHLAVATGRVAYQSRAALVVILLKFAVTPIVVVLFGATASLVSSAVVMTLAYSVPGALWIRHYVGGSKVPPVKRR